MSTKGQYDPSTDDGVTVEARVVLLSCCPGAVIVGNSELRLRLNKHTHTASSIPPSWWSALAVHATLKEGEDTVGATKYFLKCGLPSGRSEQNTRGPSSAMQGARPFVRDGQ